MKIVSDLPCNVIAYAEDSDGILYFQNGAVIPRALYNGVDSTYYIEKGEDGCIYTKNYFTDIDEENGDLVIYFKASERAKIYFDEFHEIHIELTDSKFDVRSFSAYLYRLCKKAQHVELLYDAFISNIAACDHGTETVLLILKNELFINQSDYIATMFFLVYYKVAKQLSLLFKNNTDAIRAAIISPEFTKSVLDSAPEDFKLTADFMRVYEKMNGWRYEEIVASLIHVYKLASTEKDIQSVEKTVVVISKIFDSPSRILGILAAISDLQVCTLREVMNYFLEKYFNTFEMNSCGAVSFLICLKDYMSMMKANALETGETVDYFPAIPLKEAHDNALAAYNDKDLINYGNYEVSFKKEVSRPDYLDLKMEVSKSDMVYTFETPEYITDLINESLHMRNCVKTYIPQVANGNTKIVFLRKNKKPFVTIEVKDGQIIQAYGKGNTSASIEARNIVQEWAGKKNLKYDC